MTSNQRREKIRTVMREFKAKTLKGSDGKIVRDPRQAMAIALSEAGIKKEGKSDEYWAGYIDEKMGPGEARCRGYLKKLREEKK